MKSLRYGSLKSFVNHTQLKCPVSWPDVFGRHAPLEVEIGFGTGEYLVQMASARPGHNFLGIEENIERIHKTLRKIDAGGLTNVRLLHIDARLAFAKYTAERSVHEVHCLFPCPWPRKNQEKHRLFSRNFLKLLNSRLISDGRIKLVTDHELYAQWVEGQSVRSGFKTQSQKIRPKYNTKFERKWTQAGQEQFFAFAFSKITHLKSPLQEETPLKVYFFDRFDPEKLTIDDQKGSPSIIFKEFLFDKVKNQGMIHVLVAEDFLQQHLWAKVIKTANKGWCLAVAEGTLLIPTAGVAKALEYLFERTSRI